MKNIQELVHCVPPKCCITVFKAYDSMKVRWQKITPAYALINKIDPIGVINIKKSILEIFRINTGEIVLKEVNDNWCTLKFDNIFEFQNFISSNP